MPEWLQKAVHDEVVVTLDVLVLRLVVAFILGCAAAGVYHLTTRRTGDRRGISEPRAFLATLVLLSVLIALVTLVIGSNVARAFSLVGALAIVRFRTVVEDTRDTAFVIFAVVVGMAAGAGYLEAALVVTPLVFVAAWLFAPRGAALPESGEVRLALRLGVGRPVEEQVNALLKQRVPRYRLVGVATARGGAALDVTYAVATLPPTESLALVGDLSRVEGVQSVEMKE
jgi:uncharacterized membrane protein YhiD involved in acid resistance